MNVANQILRSRLFLLVAVLSVAFFIGKPALERWHDAYIYFLMTEGQPSDQEVTKIFEEHRDLFEEIRLMAHKDEESVGAFWISDRGSNGNYTSDGRLSTQRLGDYVGLLSSIKLHSELSAIPNHYVDFQMAGGGLGPLGVDWNKGIRYIPENPEKEGLILNNLDAVKKRRWRRATQADR